MLIFSNSYSQEEEWVCGFESVVTDQFLFNDVTGSIDPCNPNGYIFAEDAYYAYIPDRFTFDKKLKVQIHFILNTVDNPRNFTAVDDGNGNIGITGYDVANEWISHANYRIMDNHQMNLPIGNTTPVLNPHFTFYLDDVHFWYDPTLNANFGYGPFGPLNAYIQDQDAINVFFISDETTNFGGIANGEGGSNSNKTVLVDQWINYTNLGNSIGFENIQDWQIGYIGSGGMMHEIGHLINIRHTLVGSTCADNDYCSDTPNASDAIASGSANPPCCWNSDLCSNNVMSYTADKVYTPQQLGRVHFDFLHGKLNFLVDDFCTKNEDEEIVVQSGENITIEGSRLINKDIVIENNATLIVKCYLHLAKDVTITVKEGGQLIVDGGILSNICGELWGGVYVEGDPNGQGGNPGRARFINDAVVENSRSAVNNFSLDVSGGVNWSTTGGLLYSNNATFINNKRDLQYLAYQNTNAAGSLASDYSQFIKSDFLTNDDFVDGESPIENVTNYKCFGIKFRGCGFADNRTGIEPFDKRTGIFVKKGSVRVNRYAACSVCAEVPSTFTNLKEGVRVYGIGSNLFNTSIKNSDFTSCWKGIYVWQNRHIEIVSNDFEVTPYPTYQNYDCPVGIYLHKRVTDYMVEENNFFPAQNSSAPMSGYSVGIVANTSNSSNEVIYRNDFKHLFVGFESIGKNKINYSGDLNYNGLRIRCNNFEDDRRDWYLVNGNENYNQYGIAHNQGSLTTPAKNTFAVNDTYINIDNEITLPDFGRLDYYAGLALEEIPTVNYIVPPDPAANVYLFISPNNNTNCPSNVDGIGIGSGKYQKSVAIEGRVQKETEMSQVLDGGDTQGLQTDIALTDNQEAWHRYVELMNKSGYITETVLEELTTNESGFTKAMTRNVLVANPHAAKSQKVTDALDARVDPLPSYMREQIRLGLTQMSSKEFLTIQRDKYKLEQDIVVDRMYHTLLNDSIPVDSMQTFIDILSNNDDIEYDYKLVELYDAANQSYLGDALLSAMQSIDLSEEESSELDRYTSFRNLKKQWSDMGKDELSLSESDIQVLETYAEINDRSGIQAITLLRMNDAIDIDEPVFISEDNRRLEFMKPNNSDKLIANDGGELRLYPNPADQYFTVEYRIDKVFENAQLRIIDVNGITVYQQKLIFEEDQVIINKSPEMKSGTYQCEISLDGMTYRVKTIILK